jgi:hypothetical protein
MRTASSEEQIKEVEHHRLTANQDIKHYYSIKFTENTVDSFEIDEWMVMLEKSK